MLSLVSYGYSGTPPERPPTQKDEEGQQHCNDMLHWLYSPSSCLSTSSSTSIEVEAADFAFTFWLFWLLLADLGVTSVICSAQQTHWRHFWPIWASPLSFALHNKHTDVTFGWPGCHLHHLLCTTHWYNVWEERDFLLQQESYRLWETNPTDFQEPVFCIIFKDLMNYNFLQTIQNKNAYSYKELKILEKKKHWF